MAFKKGFTIIELLVVIAVIAIISAIVIIGYSGLTIKANSSSVQADLTNAAKALEVYRTTSSTDSYPTLLSDSGWKSPIQATVTYNSSSKGYCVEEKLSGMTYSVTSSNKTPQQTTCTQNGLVGWWMFNNNPNDSSTLGNNAIVTGATLTTGQNNLANSAYLFNGSSYLTITNNATLNNSITTEATISLWTYLTSYGYQGGSYIRKSVDASNPIYPGFDTYDSGLIVNTSKGRLATIGMNASANTWEHHVFIISQYGSPYIKHYINGVLNQAYYSETGNLGSMANSTDITIGKSPAGGINRFYNGTMDDVRIYNRALSASEVSSLYNTGAQ